jgi:hypothetical protein
MKGAEMAIVRIGNPVVWETKNRLVISPCRYIYAKEFGHFRPNAGADLFCEKAKPRGDGG